MSSIIDIFEWRLFVDFMGQGTLLGTASNLGLSVCFFAFPMRCHPQADAGDREAV